MMITLRFILMLMTVFTYPVLVAQNSGQDWVWANSTGEVYMSNYVMNSAVDSEGNVYITGMFLSETLTFGNITLTKAPGSGTTRDTYLAKFDPDGNVLWARSAGGCVTYSNAIAVDLNDNVYIAGEFVGPALTFGTITLTRSGSGEDIFLVKYDSQGNLLFAKDFNSTGYVSVTGLASDPQGNILMSGCYDDNYPISFDGITLTSTAYHLTNAFLVKFNGSGNAIWARSAQATAVNYGETVATDQAGNVYLAGHYLASSGQTCQIGGLILPTTVGSGSVYLMRFDPDGNAEWVQTAVTNTSINAGDYIFDLLADNDGNIVLTGKFTSSVIQFGTISLANSSNNPTADIFTVKYDPAGQVIWARKGGGIGFDEGNRLTCDQDNNIYVTGYISSQVSNFGNITVTKSNDYSNNIFVVKYDQNGNESWAKHVENTNAHAGNLPANAIAAGPDGGIYVASNANNNAIFGNITLSDGGIFLAKIASSTAGINEERGADTYLVSPNPSQGTFRIEGKPLPGDARIQVFDLHGQMLFDAELDHTTISLPRCSVGLYLYTIRSGQGMLTTGKITIQ